MEHAATLAHHETVATRSRKGRSSFRITRRNMRRMGDARTTALALQRQADAILAIADSYDLVSPVTGRLIEADAIAEDHKGRPVYSARTRLVGTDVGRSWGQVTDTDGDTDAAAELASAVAHHRTSARGAVAHLFGLSEAECSVGDTGTVPEQPRHLAAWPIRTRVTAERFSPRATEHGTVTVGNPFQSAWPVPELTVRALAAPTDDGRVFIGNSRPVERSEPRTRNAARDEARTERAEARKAEAVRALAATDDGAAIVAAWNGAADGTAVTVAIRGGTLRFTRREGSSVRYTLARGTERHTWTARTPVAAAMRVATLTD